MCGLSAIVDYGAGGDLAARLLAMHLPIGHRGPDGEGFGVVDGEWNFHAADSADALVAAAARRTPRMGLAFRWLKIQDPSPEAAQPMGSPDRRHWLAFNGEIYNFRALRAELAALGHGFRTQSDTEVILAAWREWGTAMFGRLDGMWALALADLDRRRLIVARDRFGIKPLFYRLEPGALLLASEAKQLLHAGVPAEANGSVLRRFIRGARPAPRETFFSTVAAFPSAGFREVDLAEVPKDLEARTYWSLPARGREDPTMVEAEERLDAALHQAVREHMVARASVGVLVSGGLDSSLVAALSVASYPGLGQAPKAFSMVTTGPGAVDESRHVQRLAARLGFTRFAIELQPEWIRERIGEITRAQEEPVAGMAVAGQYLTFGLAAAHGMRVVLDGQGADELFGGYPRHQFAWLADLRRRGEYGKLALEGLAAVLRDSQLIRGALRGRSRRAAEPDFLPPAGRFPPEPPGSLDEALRRDVLAGNLRAVLGVTDRNAMAHSIEARVPYVSRTVVELAFSLPDRLKVGGGTRKRILREVARRHLPAQIVDRRDRVGFGVPAGEWLRRDFASDLAGLHRRPVYAQGGLAEPRGLERYVARFLAGSGDAGIVWRLYAVDQWVRAFDVTGLRGTDHVDT